MDEKEALQFEVTHPLEEPDKRLEPRNNPEELNLKFE